MADALDLKSNGLNTLVGSTPTLRTGMMCKFVGSPSASHLREQVGQGPPLAAHTIQVVRIPLYARIYPIAALAQLVEQLICK